MRTKRPPTRGKPRKRPLPCQKNEPRAARALFVLFAGIVQSRLSEIELGPFGVGHFVTTLPRQQQQFRQRAKRPADFIAAMPKPAHLFIGEHAVARLFTDGSLIPAAGEAATDLSERPN